MGEPIKVFVSYSHDSREHQDRVLELSNRLRADGIDCDIDQYEVSPPEGWPLWMERMIREAEFVLVVCTETYLRRTEGREAPGKGHGVRWESLLAIQDIYDAGSLNEKFVPVIFDPADAEHRPTPLRGATYYCVDGNDGYGQLLQRLRGIPRAERPPLGTPSPVPQRERQERFFTSPRDNFLEVDIEPNNDFVGRREVLEELHERLSGGDVAITHALSGEGGVGKTEIAKAYAFEHAGDYDGRWWVDASTEGIEASLVRLAAAMGIALPTQATPEQIRADLRRALSAGKHLLILDNLGNTARMEGLRPRDPARVLITTRLTDLPPAFVRSLDVEVFEPADSIALLRKHRPDLAGDDHDDALLQVAEYLGHHALAVTLAAAYLQKRGNVSPGELLERLGRAEIGDEKDLLEGVDAANASAGYRRGVAACLGLHLLAFEGTPGMDLLARAAFCHPDDIPIELFVESTTLGKEEVETWLGKLAAVSMVKYKQTVSLHKLTQSVIRARLDEEAQRGALSALVGVLADRFKGALDFRNWPMQDGYAAHAQFAVEHGERVGRIERVGTLGNQLGVYFQKRARFDDALLVFRTAERIARAAAFGDDHDNVATRVNNIGAVLLDKGDLDGALACYREAERIDRAVSGDDHPDVATRVNNIGAVLLDKGDLEGALACFREAERIDRAAFGDDHPKVASDVNNIGAVLKKKGELDEALACYREAERIDRAASGDAHPDVARTVNNIGLVLWAQGDLAGALTRLREAERIDRAALGDDHPSVARDLANIGGVLKAKGDLDEARRMGERAFRILCTTKGPRALDTAKCAENLKTIGVDPVALAREVAGDKVAEELREALRERAAEEERKRAGQRAGVGGKKAKAKPRPKRGPSRTDRRKARKRKSR